MGSGPNGTEDIKNHVFFFSINWKDIENKVVTPPYLPEIESELDLRNIDKMFTKEKPQETFEDSHLL